MAKKLSNRKEVAIQKIQEAIVLLTELYADTPQNPISSAITDLELTIREINKV